MSSLGAVTMTRALSGSATTRGSATAAPAFAAETSDAGQRERSESTAVSADTTTSGATWRSWITLKSACGAVNALPSSSARICFARSVPSLPPTITMVPDCGSADSSTRDAPPPPAFSRMRRASSTSAAAGALVGVNTAHARAAASESRSSSRIRPSATLMMRAAPETMSELVRVSLSTRTGGVGASCPRERRARSSARRGSVSCWSARSFCTSGATRVASAFLSAKVLASTESSAGRSSSGAISLSASSRSAVGPTMSSAFEPVAGMTLTASGSRVTGLVAAARAWPRLVATSVASAYSSGRTRTTGSPAERLPSSSWRTSSSTTGMSTSGALTMSAFERRSGAMSSTRVARPASAGSISARRPSSALRTSGASASGFAPFSLNTRSVVAGAGAPSKPRTTCSTRGNTVAVALTTSVFETLSVLTTVDAPSGPNLPAVASSRMVFATPSRLPSARRQVRISDSGTDCARSSCSTSFSKPAMREIGASTMSELVCASARTTTSRGGCSSGRTRPRGSTGTGGGGYISSIVRASSAARAIRSEKMRISRSDADWRVAPLRSSTICWISGSRSGCAATMRALVCASAVIWTGFAPFSSGERCAYDCMSAFASVAASAVRSWRMRSGGVEPTGTSRLRSSTASSSCWRASAATSSELVRSSTSITGSFAKPALWPRRLAASPSRYALASTALAWVIGITRTSALGAVAVASWRQASAKRASGSSSPLATMVPLAASISVSIAGGSPSRTSSDARRSAFASRPAASAAPTSITRTPRLVGTACSWTSSCSVFSKVIASPATMSVRLWPSVWMTTSTGLAPSAPGFESMPRAPRSRRVCAMRSMSPFSTR